MLLCLPLTASVQFCPGGELFELMHKQPNKRFLENDARFFAAEVLLSLQYLHMLGFIYRDLKPENVLLQADGHVLLTDFDLSFCASCKPQLTSAPGGMAGLANLPMLVRLFSWVHFYDHLIADSTQIAEPFAFTNSFVGTEEYLSPEACWHATSTSDFGWVLTLAQVINASGHTSTVDWWELGMSPRLASSVGEC